MGNCNSLLNRRRQDTEQQQRHNNNSDAGFFSSTEESTSTPRAVNEDEDGDERDAFSETVATLSSPLTTDTAGSDRETPGQAEKPQWPDQQQHNQQNSKVEDDEASDTDTDDDADIASPTERLDAPFPVTIGRNGILALLPTTVCNFTPEQQEQDEFSDEASSATRTTTASSSSSSTPQPRLSYRGSCWRGSHQREMRQLVSPYGLWRTTFVAETKDKDGGAPPLVQPPQLQKPQQQQQQQQLEEDDGDDVDSSYEEADDIDSPLGSHTGLGSFAHRLQSQHC